MKDPVPLLLNGRELEPELPALLQPVSRGTGQPEDPFLPAGYLKAVTTYDVGPAARSAAEGAGEQEHAASADEVIVLELADGSTFISSAERLRASLAQARPDLLGDQGEILLEKLRAEGAAARGALTDAAGGLVRKVFTFVAGREKDAIVADAAAALGGDTALLGVSWAGTRALMRAIEARLDQPAGRLYRWTGVSGTTDDLQPVDLIKDPPEDLERRPLLVFVHGTGSSTTGSFGELRRGDGDVWAALEQTYGDRIYAFEHRTLSESPIENAIELVASLPAGARVSLVSHSRGGLVADLLCLDVLSAEVIERYAFELAGTGDPDEDHARYVIGQLGEAHAEQRAQLRELARLLAEKKLVVERYVRTASPANGTLLASGNFDLFLSGVLSLIGTVPLLFGSPYYAAFKRVVIEIAKNRTDPHLVPGIEAMLPDSPMARLLRDARPKGGIQMAVIAGDIEGGSLLKRLGLLLTDFLLFENTDNDLVVDTRAMLAGVAPALAARVFFDRGADVSHFRYFLNHETRAALRAWLVSEQPDALAAFRPLPAPEEYARALAEAVSRDAITADKPVVVVLPGIMGSHLNVNRKDRVWLDIADIVAGGLGKIAWGKPGVEGESLLALAYGELCEELARSHVVRPFAYDWRQPLDVLGDRLGEFLDGLMRATAQPIRLLVHSMGGLVVRACIHERRAVMDALMARDGARLVMCGTPNQGAHSMVETLLGKGDTVRLLARLDLQHDMQEVLDIVAGFRGALQLLPKPGFTDTFEGQPGGGERHDYSRAETWLALGDKVRDFWFGNRKCGRPGQAALDAAGWLWQADGPGAPALPPDYEKKVVYVFGVAPNTPCGVREESGRLKLVGTAHGDGMVTWDSGRIGGIGSFYYLPAAHGDMLATRGFFGGLTDLLASGSTVRLPASPPATRAIEQPAPVVYDAGPPTVEDGATLSRVAVGGSLRERMPPRRKRRLEVAVKAMDLRAVTDPILVGHYEQDPISGPEELIDRELLDGDLSARHALGLYAGPRGTVVVVLRVPNRFQQLKGAVVTGLGRYDGMLSLSDLTEAVRTGVLRYLLQIVDVLGPAEREVSLSTLLIGYNSSANLTIGASVEALVRGVMEANASFHEATRVNIRVGTLNIVELYLDTAISAAYALRQMPQRLGGLAQTLGTGLVVHGELVQGESVRQRLYDDRSASYWPRLIVTDADRPGDGGAADGYPVDGGAGPVGVAGLVGASGSAGVAGAAGLASAAGSAGTAGSVGAAGSAGAAGSVGAAGGRLSSTEIATRLRFLYVGQRARAESVVQQRQPGLIEKLVRQQIHTAVWQEDLGRMLFHLMVPQDFKDAARQLERIVLVVDGYTANLPWELMLAHDPSRPDDERLPLAVRTPLVRQLNSTRFRRQVRQGVVRTALVVGNPSVDGFAANFVGPGGRPLQEPPNLEGAEAEAQAAARVLSGLGYRVTTVIGNERPASDVLSALYREPYRILHISAHGVFDLQHRDGQVRSGVVLSDGLLVTAAEIRAMETVPELVVLNCCHLGTVDVGRNGNLLAASIARELIDIGVRCVVVAGWAVNDALASHFGEVFYRELLVQRKGFGDAVFAARGAAWNRDRSDITWGAFQAYGDAGWRAERRIDGGGAAAGAVYASPSELLDALARTRADVARERDRHGEREARAQAAAVKELLGRRCPKEWLLLAQVQSALGATWCELGQFESAREAYAAAIQAEDRAGGVPIRAIEQLADVEARLGERSGQMDLIDVALARLRALGDAVGAPAEPGPPRVPPNPERSAIRGSAWKRKAGVCASALLAGGIDEERTRELGAQMEAALKESVAAYREAEVVPTPAGGEVRPYNRLNRLALNALTPWADESAKEQAIGLGRECRADAERRYARAGEIWDAVMQPEALLVERLIDGTLGLADPDGTAALEEVAAAYGQVLADVTITPAQLDSVVTQLGLLARFHDALAIVKNDASRGRVADRLEDLVERMAPGRAGRKDRPTPARGRGGVGGTAKRRAGKTQETPAKA